MDVRLLLAKADCPIFLTLIIPEVRLSQSAKADEPISCALIVIEVRLSQLAKAWFPMLSRFRFSEFLNFISEKQYGGIFLTLSSMVIVCS